MLSRRFHHSGKIPVSRVKKCPIPDLHCIGILLQVPRSSNHLSDLSCKPCTATHYVTVVEQSHEKLKLAHRSESNQMVFPHTMIGISPSKSIKNPIILHIYVLFVELHEEWRHGVSSFLLYRVGNQSTRRSFPLWVEFVVDSLSWFVVVFALGLLIYKCAMSAIIGNYTNGVELNGHNSWHVKFGEK